MKNRCDYCEPSARIKGLLESVSELTNENCELRTENRLLTSSLEKLEKRHDEMVDVLLEKATSKIDITNTTNRVVRLQSLDDEIFENQLFLRSQMRHDPSLT